MKIEVRAQPETAVQCAVCHGRLWLAVACPDCDTRLHADCRLVLGRCPTLGCPRNVPARRRFRLRWPRSAPQPSNTAPKPRPRPLWLFLSLLTIGLVVGGLVYAELPGFLNRAPEPTESQRALDDLNQLVLGIEAFRTDTGRLPEDLNELWVRPKDCPGWWGPYATRAHERDPWGWRYDYRIREDGGYEVVSWGRDGATGGKGPDWDLRRIGTPLPVPWWQEGFAEFDELDDAEATPDPQQPQEPEWGPQPLLPPPPHEQ